MRNFTSKHFVHITLVACLGLVACAESGAAPPETAPPQPSTSIKLSRIPDGTYERVATRAEAEALGIPADLIDAMLGPDGKASFAFTFAGDKWMQFGTDDAAFEQVGDLGTSTYDSQGRWVSTSDGSGCHGCVATFEWSYADGSLTLKMTSIEGSPTPEGDRFVTEGTYHLRAPRDSSGTDVTTLTFANALDDLLPEITAFMVQLRSESRGTVALDFHPNYAMESGAVSEAAIISDVAQGTLDIGWVSARAFPEFEALLAPMLVDSYELQEAIFDAGVPTRMLGDLADPRIVAIAVLPGPMRKIMGVDAPLLTASDFKGKVIAASGSPHATAAMLALGATRQPANGGMTLDGIDGLEAALLGMSDFSYPKEANSVTANLNWWPRPLVVIINREVFERLTLEQQEAFRTAATSVIGPAAIEARNEEVIARSILCNSPIDVLETSVENLRQIEAALQPVYAKLEAKPKAAAYVEEIRAIKDDLRAPPATLVCD